MGIERQKITILYGSETGNAQDYAHYLSKRLRYYQVQTVLSTLDDFELKRLVTDVEYLIIICSTTGQGELPRNAKKFMHFILRKKLPNDLFDHISLTTFGLGDSSYPKFNYGIKKIHTRMKQLGCQELSPSSEADELSAEGIDGYYKIWEEELLASIQRHIPDAISVDDEILLEPEFKVQIAQDSPEVVTKGNAKEISLSRNSSVKDDMANEVLQGTILVKERVTSEDHFQDVRRVVIHSDTEISYAPGDTIALYPSNSEEDVEALLKSQSHWIPLADKPLSISGNLFGVQGGIIKDLTLRNLLTHHLDLSQVPTRSFFFTLWHFIDGLTEDGEREKERAKEFSNINESEELYNYANRPRRLVLETLLEFENNLEIPVEYILDLFSFIKPRLFLIASCPSKHEVELVIALVEYKTIMRKTRKGLCSTWLKSLDEGDKIVFSVHASNMHFPKDKPIILAATGTGIAPMKSLVENLVEEKYPQNLYLFYGCRYLDKDYLFRLVWDRTEDLKNFSVFSREATNNVKYIQHKLYEQAKLVGDLILNQDATFYLCGSNGKMPREVRITLVEILKLVDNMTEEEAEKYLFVMESKGRYLQETW